MEGLKKTEQTLIERGSHKRKEKGSGKDMGSRERWLQPKGERKF